MLGWRNLLRLVVLVAASFLLSSWTGHRQEHSGTVSNVLWMDFLLGVVLLIALAAVAAARPVASLWH